MHKLHTYIHAGHAHSRRARLLLIVFVLIYNASPALAQQQVAALTTNTSTSGRAAVEAPRPKRLAPLRASETSEGARVTITADAALGDYSAYRTGDRFFVRLPRANFVAAQRDLSAGLTEARVEQQGADVLLSFHLPLGATAHVRQNFNRLDVLIAAQDQQQSGGTAVATSDKKDADKQPPVTPPTTATDAAAPAPATLPTTTTTPVNTTTPSLDATAATATTTTNATATTPAAAATKATGGKGRPALPPEKANPVRVVRFETAPVIDGKLDDGVWKTAAVFKDFYQTNPGDNIAPSKPTEMMMGYDAKTLYIAFHCYDEPDKVRATVPKRDQIWDDDYVGMFLDTFNDKRKAYAFFFSPLGVQADGILTESQGEDYSPDVVMESKGTLTSDGYIVEIAIPFKSLRYEAGKDKQWGAHFFRRIKRLNNELDSWMPNSRDISGTLLQAGHLTGLEGISTERTLELIPSITISETGRRVRAFPPQPSGAGARGVAPLVDTGRFLNRPIEADIGLTAKYSLTPTVTLDFAYNPDFAQVEADATVVQANQRFPIFFEEKRPFFLEGKDIFNTANTVVHTRAIVDPDFAAKITGKRGRNTFGLILASDNAPGNFGEDELDDRQRAIITAPDDETRRRRSLAYQDLLDNVLGKNALIGVLRLKRDVGRESSLGLFATSYNFGEHGNQLAGFDGRFKVNPTSVASFEVIGTTLRDCGRDFNLQTGALNLNCARNNGFGYSFSYDVTKRHTGWYFSNDGRTQNYRADVGFTRRTNTNESLFSYRISTEPKPKAKFISFRWNNFTYSDYDFQGRHQGWGNGNNFNFTFAGQAYLFVGTNIGYTRLFAEEFGGQFAGTDQERQSRHKALLFEVGKTFNKKYSGWVFMNMRRGAFDFDFGAGPNYPRISPVAIAARAARAAGQCEETEGQSVPEVCNDTQDPGPGTQFDIESGFTYQPTNALRVQLNYTKSRLTRYDTGFVAFDDNIFVMRSTYQFTRFTFARARVDYDSLGARMRGQFLLGWTPNPGTAFYVGYNDDLNRNGFNPFNNNLEPGFRRNGRTFFIKASYLFRRSFE